MSSRLLLSLRQLLVYTSLLSCTSRRSSAIPSGKRTGTARKWVQRAANFQCRQLDQRPSVPSGLQQHLGSLFKSAEELAATTMGSSASGLQPRCATAHISCSQSQALGNTGSWMEASSRMLMKPSKTTHFASYRWTSVSIKPTHSSFKSTPTQQTAKASAAKLKHYPPELGLLYSSQILQAIPKHKTPLAPNDCAANQCQQLEQRAKAAGQRAQTAECTDQHNSGYETRSTSLATAKLIQFCSQSSCRTMTQSTFFTQESIKKTRIWGHLTHITNKVLAHPNKGKAATVMDTLSSRIWWNLKPWHVWAGLSQLRLCND